MFLIRKRVINGILNNLFHLGLCLDEGGHLILTIEITINKLIFTLAILRAVYDYQCVTRDEKVACHQV